jgi:hypothetical protein
VERLNGLQHECRLQQDLAEQAQERLKRLEYAADKLAERHLLVPTTYPQALAHVAEYHREKGEA